MDQARLGVHYVLSTYDPGSGKLWHEEFAWLLNFDSKRLASLVTRIANEGIRESILLGDDGRVWDGHHRLLAARILGIKEVPVTYGHTKKEGG